MELGSEEGMLKIKFTPPAVRGQEEERKYHEEVEGTCKVRDESPAASE